MQNILQYIKLVAAGIAGAASYLFGGLDMLLILLLALIAIDYVTGVLCAIYNKELSSQVGFKGIVKKVLILCIVAVAHLTGQAIGLPEVRSFVIGFYIANEGISVLENAGTLGVPLPKKLMDVLKQLKSEGDNDADSIQHNQTDNKD